MITPETGSSAFVAMLDKVAEESLTWRWDRATGQHTLYSPPQPGRMIRLTPLSEGRLLSATGRCGEGHAEARLWSAPTEGTMSIARVSGRLLWAARDLSRIVLVDREGGIVQSSLVEGGAPVRRWATELFESKRWDPFVPRPVASAGGERVFMVQGNHRVEALSLAEEAPRPLFEADDELTRLMLHPDGARLITASFDGRVMVHDATSGAPLMTLDGGDRVVIADAMRLSDDGARLFVGYDDMTFRVWDMTTGALRATLHVPEEDDTLHGETRLVRFHTDGVHALASHQNHVVHVWNTVTGEHAVTWRGPDPITTCRCDAQGRVWLGDIEARITVLAGTSPT